MSDSEGVRARQRRETKQRIIDAARRQFAELGYERSTIRAIAREAEADPGLVMHYFKSKEELFKSAAQVSAAAPADTDTSAVDSALNSLGVKIGGMPEEVVANLRSMLTHDQSAARVRAILDAETESLAGRLSGPARRERAALMLATNLGVTIAREMLGVTALHEAEPAELLDLLRPAVEALASHEPS